MKRRSSRRSTVTPMTRHTTVRPSPPPVEPMPLKPAPRVPTPKPLGRATAWARTTAPRRQVARIIDEDEATLLDVVDNMLNRGIVINADLILALANVDLVYVRLSALLCAADRLLGRRPR